MLSVCFVCFLCCNEIYLNIETNKIAFCPNFYLAISNPKNTYYKKLLLSLYKYPEFDIRFGPTKDLPHARFYGHSNMRTRFYRDIIQDVHVVTSVGNYMNR